MRRWISAAAGALALLATPGLARAQGSLFDRIDRLRLRSLSLAYGPVTPKNVVGTQSFGAEADYGQIAGHWHVVFDVGYWASRFDNETVARFVDQLKQSVVDPTGDDSIVADRVRVSDLSLEVEGRWMPGSATVLLRPYLGGALGAHVVNVQSKLIDHTFVASALDGVATGLTAVAGLELAPLPRLGIGVEARYTLMSNVRFGTVRALATYHFSYGRPPAQR